MCVCWQSDDTFCGGTRLDVERYPVRRRDVPDSRAPDSVLPSPSHDPVHHRAQLADSVDVCYLQEGNETGKSQITILYFIYLSRTSVRALRQPLQNN